VPSLNKNSDNIVEVDKLTDQLGGQLISGATVSVTVKDTVGNDLAGETWPVAMPEVSAGLYRGNLPDTLVLDGKKIVIATFVADAGSALHREWCVEYIVVC